MLKNLTGGAVINYSPTFPSSSGAYDGALFYKSSGADQGLYIFSFNQDANLSSIGDQVTQGWNPIVTVGAFVSKLGDTMTGTLTISGLNTGTGFGSGEQVLVLNNSSATTNARSGAIQWTYGSSPNISAQIDTIQGSGNSKGTLVLSTRGATGTLTERVRVDENGLTVGGNVFWHGGNDGTGSGLDADLLDGQDGTFYRNASNINAGTLSSARLPYTPVHQGGGTNQGTNNVYIGWAAPSEGANKLFLQVDSTDFNDTWPMNINGNAATANSANTAANATNATNATSAQFVRRNGAAGGINMTFNYTAGAGAQPTYVWGTNDGTDIHIWNPNTFSVAAATTATNATNATYATNLREGGSPTGTVMTFNWDGQSGQPTWLWGGTDGQNMYTYNPSNFNVNFATTAGTANAVAWTNVSGRPTNVSSFTNDSGYITEDDIPEFPTYPGSLATNGYQTLPGGVLIQWGTVTVSADTTMTVTFPIPFPTAVFNIQATPVTTVATGFNGKTAGAGGASLTGFTIVNDDGDEHPISWFAIGH